MLMLNSFHTIIKQIITKIKIKFTGINYSYFRVRAGNVGQMVLWVS